LDNSCTTFGNLSGEDKEYIFFQQDGATTMQSKTKWLP